MEDIYHKCGGGGDTQYQLKMSNPKFHIIFAGIKRKCNWDWVPDDLACYITGEWDRFFPFFGTNWNLPVPPW